MVSLHLRNIQGNVVPGFKKDHQCFLPLRFGDDPAQARRWLAELTPEIALAEDVLAFNTQFSNLVSRRKRDGWLPDPRAGREENRDYGVLLAVSATWVNVAFTWAGLHALCGDRLHHLAPSMFQPRLRGIPTPDDDSVHAVLLVAADWLDDLEREFDRQLGRLSRFGLTAGEPFMGQTLPDSREHFGYRDGISQPRLAGIDDAGPYLPPGDFVLGYPASGNISSASALPDWSKDGSFLVFLQLEQDVRAFRAARRDNVESARLRDAAQVGAAFMGRWPSGAPAGSDLEDIRRTRSDPGWGGELRPTGQVPDFSHVGRANPRQENPALRHRLIRRGIPYGKPLGGNNEDDTSPRGLLFLSYQADIHAQFEGVWFNYLQDASFPVSGAGADPVVGQAPTGARTVVLRGGTDEAERIELRLGQFVTLRYGRYLFAPSLSALKELSGDPMTLTEHDLGEIRRLIAEVVGNSNGHHSESSQTAYGGGTLNRNTRPGATISAENLGALIMRENPYTTASSVKLNGYITAAGPAKDNYGGTDAYQIEAIEPGQDDPREYWYVDHQRIAITKSLRVIYTYRDEDGNQHGASLIIGFNGPPMP